MFVLAVAATIMTFAVGYAVGGQSAIEDNWVAVLGLTMALVGLLDSLAAFVLAIVAKIRRERWTLLWAPLSAFPAFVAFLVLGEALVGVVVLAPGPVGTAKTGTPREKSL